VAIGGVVINFAARTATAVRDIGKVSRSLEDVDDDAKKADTRTSRLGRGLKVGLAAGATAAAAGLFLAADFMVDVAKAAYDDDRAAKKLTETLKKIPGVTDKMVDANAAWIDTMELATNIADDDLRVAVGKLATATGNLTQAEKLTKLAADASVGSHRSLSSVTDMLVKATNGNTNALMRAYPWLDKNKDGAVTLKEAMKGLERAYGGAAEAAGEQDVWQSLKTIWGQIKEQLGQFVLPLLNKFRDWFKDDKNKARIQGLITKIGELSTALGKKLVPMLETFLEYISSGRMKRDIDIFKARLDGIVRVFQNIWRWVNNVINVIATFISALGRVPSWARSLFPTGGKSGGGRGSGGGEFSATPTATSTAAPAYVTPPTVIVTEDQVYQAVSRLLIRGQARHGRLVVVG